MAKEVLTTSGVAIKYALPENKVRTLANAGLLPHTRDNTNKRVFDAAGVERAMRVLRGQEDSGR